MAEGMAHGVQTEKIDTARCLLAIGATADVIMVATGLSAGDIAKISGYSLRSMNPLEKVGALSI